MRARRGVVLGAICAAAAVTLVGCGSTVTLTGMAAQDATTTTNAFGQPTLSATSGAVPSTATQRVSTQAATATMPGDASTFTTSSTSTNVASTGGASTTKVRGFTAKTVRIGIITVDPSSTKNLSTLGINGFSSGDTPAFWRAVIKDRNAHGGLFGHQIEPVFALINITTTDPTGDAQKACTKFTQDTPVYAVFSDLIWDDTFAGCLSKANVPFTVSAAAVDQGSLLTQATAVLSAGLTLNRLATNYVDGLSAAGFLTSHTKIGLIRVDTPRYAGVQKDSFDPAMARHGLKLTAEAVVSPINNGDYGAMSSQLQSAVLKFRAAGVDRVLFLTINATEPLLFMTAADSQHYKPDYGLTTGNYPSVLETTAPKSQLVDAQGIGWEPYSDVSDARDPGLTPAQKACFAVMLAGGQKPAARSEKLIALGICDSFNLFVAASAKEASPVLGRAYPSVVEGLGEQVVPTVTFSTKFFTHHRDGASSFRPTKWDNTCSCFAYSGALRPLT